MGKRSGVPHATAEYEALTRDVLDAEVGRLKVRLKFVGLKNKRLVEKKLVTLQAVRLRRFGEAPAKKGTAE